MRKTSKTLFLHAHGVLGLFLEAFDQNESILFPQVGIGSEVRWVKFYQRFCQSIRLKVSASVHIHVKVRGCALLKAFHLVGETSRSGDFYGSGILA